MASDTMVHVYNGTLYRCSKMTVKFSCSNIKDTFNILSEEEKKIVVWDDNGDEQNEFSQFCHK